MHPNNNSEIRTWLWQCKSGKVKLNRKDIVEIPYLLKENKATCYGLFCSNMLTPSAIIRFKTIAEEISPGELKFYPAKELWNLVCQFPDIVDAYDITL